MRLSCDQAAFAVDLVHRYLGEGARVWLFGSRVDDNARGGDIDLYVETPIAETTIPAARCRGALEDLFDIKVDLVVNDLRRVKPIYAIARREGVELVGRYHRPMSDEELEARDAGRDIGNEILEAVRDMKAGKAGI